MLILDEPTSSLDRDEVLELFALMRRLKDEGVAILFVSHFLDQIYEVCDRMTVLRNGALVGEHMVRDLDQVGLVQLMIGKALDQLEELHDQQLHSDVGELLLKADGLGRVGGIAPSTWRSRRARSSDSPDSSAPAAPNSPGCSSAPTTPTAAS